MLNPINNLHKLQHLKLVRFQEYITNKNKYVKLVIFLWRFKYKGKHMIILLLIRISKANNHKLSNKIVII